MNQEQETEHGIDAIKMEATSLHFSPEKLVEIKTMKDLPLILEKRILICLLVAH